MTETTATTAIVQAEPVPDPKVYVNINDPVALQKALNAYVKKYLVETIDFGKIPYCGDKPSLFKPGAEKLARFFKLRSEFICIDKQVVFPMQQGQTELFYYHYKCILYRFGEKVGECEGSANSRERKFRKKDNTFDYGSVNTIQKMAQKRAFVGAVLLACGASEMFTQDLED